MLYLQGGDAAQAVTHFRDSIRLDPTNAPTHYNLGLALSEERRFDEATAAFRRAVDLNPDYAEAYNNLGAMLQVAGRFDEAADHYRRALSIRPENAEAHDNLGRILAARGRGAEALRHFREALALRPEWASPLRGLAWVYATSSGSGVAGCRTGRQLCRARRRLDGTGRPDSARRTGRGVRGGWPVRSSDSSRPNRLCVPLRPRG